MSVINLSSLGVPQALYNSGINYEISTFWDSGFEWKLGDHMNGYKAEGNADTHVLALHQLARAALQHCLLYTSPSPRDQRGSRMPSSA